MKRTEIPSIKEQETIPGAWHSPVPAYQKGLGEAQQPLALIAQPDTIRDQNEVSLQVLFFLGQVRYLYKYKEK